MAHWTAPFQLYEAACPFAVWLSSYGIVSDDVMAQLSENDRDSLRRPN